ncbi:MAG: hypothetical protein KKA12_06105 [Alphaproteobacteria bacterium]|nr:hypothetical protein [Alphaproteobacteria bacterium]
MNFAGAQSATADAADSLLRADLAHGEAVLASIRPVLRRLVANADHAMFSEEAVARTRGLIESLAWRLVRQAGGGMADAAALAPAEALIGALAAQPDLLAHCHALVVEGQLGERLEREARIDPVLPPLLQAQITSAAADPAAIAMALFAAQARFVQGFRRMEITPGELPADLLHGVLAAFVQTCGSEAERVAGEIRAEFDEARSRLALLGRVALGLGDSFDLALEPDQAGIALFVTALALMAGQERDAVVLATTDGQQARLALLMAIAGLAPAAAEAVLLKLHPDATIPRHCLGVSREQAETLLMAGGGA